MTPSDSQKSPDPKDAVRVQVVARWNHWVQVLDPRDGSLTWVNLDEAAFKPA